MPTEASERPTVSYARREGTEHCLAEARRLAHEVEALLDEAAKSSSALGDSPDLPGIDAYSLRIAQGLVRCLIDQLVERPASSGRIASGSSGRNGSGSARVA
jgi:hypothetical protein